MKRIHLNLATTRCYDRKRVYSVMAGVVLLALILSLYNVHRYIRYTSQVREIEERIAQVEKSDKGQSRAAQPPLPLPTQKEMDTLREQAAFVNRLITMDIYPWDRLLDELESCTPPNILILRFTTTKERDRVRIEGNAVSMAEITEFLKALDRSSLYRASALLNVTTPKDAGQSAMGYKSPAIRFEIETTAAVEPPLRKQG